MQQQKTSGVFADHNLEKWEARVSFSTHLIQRNLCKMLVSKPEGEKSLGRTKHNLDHMYENDENGS
jgi:hypothetical protein